MSVAEHTVADRVITLCEQRSGRKARLDSTIAVDLDLDSLDRVELAMVLEDTFSVAISDDEVDNPKLSTVQSLVDLVEQKLAK